MVAMGESVDKYPPTKLGEYVVLEDIAEGTFGRVKSALLDIHKATLTSPPSPSQWLDMSSRDTRSR